MRPQENTDVKDTDDDRLGIQSVEIAATILRAFADRGGLMHLREISTATKMHRGKVHRYLTSLTRGGLLYQDDASGAYGIGSLSIALGLAGLRGLDPVRLALREIPAFADEVNETIVVSIWGDVGPTVIAIQESRRPITLNVRAGSILPLRRSAAGQIFEAFMPEQLTAPVLERELKATPQQTRLSKHLLPLAEVRRRQMAFVKGDLIPGIHVLAAPVFNHMGKLSLVVGVLGQQETLDVGWTSKPALMLKQFTERLSSELGFKMTAPHSINK